MRGDNWRSSGPRWFVAHTGADGTEVIEPEVGIDPATGPLIEHVKATRAPYEGQLTRYVHVKRLERSAELRAAYADLRDRESSNPRTPEHRLEELRARIARIEESL